MIQKLVALSLILGMIGSARCEEAPGGKLIVFHAGSLSVPFKQIGQAFNKQYPDVEILFESAGSLDCARKISDLNRPCDVFASADYLVIDKLLIPAHAEWNIKFAANEMTLVYHDTSRRSAELTATNWFTILQDPAVAFGRANPNADPCGYRAVLSMQLAEKHYQKPGLADALLKKDANYIRPKEVDLLALLESGTIDYIFLYRSVAVQHGLNYLLLPDPINLKKAELAEHYAQASVQLSGKKPGEYVTQKGEPMVYGITIPTRAPNPVAARAFVKFVLTRDHGMKIIETLGQPSVVPSPCSAWEKLPVDLQPFATPRK